MDGTLDFGPTSGNRVIDFDELAAMLPAPARPAGEGGSAIRRCLVVWLLSCDAPHWSFLNQTSFKYARHNCSSLGVGRAREGPVAPDSQPTYCIAPFHRRSHHFCDGWCEGRRYRCPKSTRQYPQNVPRVVGVLRREAWMENPRICFRWLSLVNDGSDIMLGRRLRRRGTGEGPGACPPDKWCRQWLPFKALHSAHFSTSHAVL